MIKKLLLPCLACMILLSINSFAKITRRLNQDIKYGWGLGIDYATYQPDESAFALLLTYNTRALTAALGGSYQRNKFEPLGTKATWFAWRAHLGLRHLLSHRLFMTWGIAGGYAFDTNNPYALGPYVGLDYYLLKKIFLSFKVTPYMYLKKWNNSKRSSFFNEGSIALTYTF